MKTTSIIIVLCAVFSGRVIAGVPDIFDQLEEESPQFPAEFTNRAGVVYRNIRVQQAYPDGLMISYATPKNVRAMDTISFEELSPELQKHYGYDPTTRSLVKHPEPARVHQTISAQPTTEIKTIDGKIYRVLSVKKVEPDGLLVEFVPDTGGIGLSKIKFKNLPSSLQEQYGYDPRREAEFETEQAEGWVRWRAEQLANKAYAERAAQIRQDFEQELLAQREREQAEAQKAEEARQQEQRLAEAARQQTEMAAQMQRQTELLERAERVRLNNPANNEWYANPYNPYSASAVAYPARPVSDSIVAYPTFPGSNMRDFTRSGVKVETDGRSTVAYPTFPGSNMRDFTRSGIRLDKE